MSGYQDYNNLHNKGIYSKELISALIELKNKDVEGFTNLMLEVLRFDPAQVIADSSPSFKKTGALNKMMEYLETTERYEDCSFVRDLIKRINEQ